MNISLKDYGGRLAYADQGIKRIKQTVSVEGYRFQPTESQDEYSFVQRNNMSADADVVVVSVPHHGSFGAQRGVVFLNGECYELVGRIVTGGTIESLISRTAVDESIDDGTIDYHRLTTRVARKRKSGGISGVLKVASCMADSDIFAGVVKQLKKVVVRGSKPSPRNVILSITGTLVEKTTKHFVIDWYGGGKLAVARSRADGDWDALSVGQWIEATISRRISGEVVSAMLVGTVEEPQGFSEVELAKSYSSIPAAELDPVE